MKLDWAFPVAAVLLLCGFAWQNTSSTPASGDAIAQVKLELQNLAALSRKISTAPANQDKARTWLELNREAKKFGDAMNAAFPETQISGDKITPAEAQAFAKAATSYGVRVEFCEPGGNWAADNQGYFKYLELWPDGPDADEATWMGPTGNGSFCGDSEGSVEELQEFISQRKSFLQRFPNSRFADQARKDISDATDQLAHGANSDQH